MNDLETAGSAATSAIAEEKHTGVANQRGATHSNTVSEDAANTGNPMVVTGNPKVTIPELRRTRSGIGDIFREVRTLVGATTRFVEDGAVAGIRRTAKGLGEVVKITGIVTGATKTLVDAFQGLKPEEQQRKLEETKQKRQTLEGHCEKIQLENDFLQRNIDALLAENADILFERRRLYKELEELDHSLDLSSAQVASLKKTVVEARRRKGARGKQNERVRKKRALFAEQKSLKYGQSLQSRLKTDNLRKAMRAREILLKKENEALKHACSSMKSVTAGCGELQKAIKNGMASQETLLGIQKELQDGIERTLAREKALMDQKKAEQLDKLNAKLERAKANQNWIICSLSSGWCFAILVAVIIWGSGAALLKLFVI